MNLVALPLLPPFPVENPNDGTYDESCGCNDLKIKVSLQLFEFTHLCGMLVFGFNLILYYVLFLFNPISAKFTVSYV